MSDAVEAVVFCGIQASGKTTFYRERFFETHVRISMDLLRTRRREGALLEACLASGQRFVVDNTNPSREERRRYVAPALAAKFDVVAYAFEARPRDAIERNDPRLGKQRIPIGGILGTFKRLERPRLDEGFSAIYRVTIVDGGFAAERVA